MVDLISVALNERGQLLDRAQRDLAAERARLDEVRSALAAMTERLQQHDKRSAEELNENRRQLMAAIERADAADRRVGMELERERTARAKAERHTEALQKSADVLREAAAAAGENARRQLDSARDREEALKGQLTTAVTELTVARQRLLELRVASEASAADASTARAQVAGMHASLDRLATLVESGTQREGKSRPKRGARALVSGQ